MRLHDCLHARFDSFSHASMFGVSDRRRETLPFSGTVLLGLLTVLSGCSIRDDAVLAETGAGGLLAAGTAGLPAQGGTGAQGCLPTDDPRTAGLHGCVQLLDGTRVRITYDFETALQLLDWPVRSTGGGIAASLRDGRLSVPGSSGQSTAILAESMRLDYFSAQVEIPGYADMAVYFDAVWDGNSFAPEQGVVCAADSYTKVVFEDQFETVLADSGLAHDVEYAMELSVSNAGFEWKINSESLSHSFQDTRQLPTLRGVGIASFESDVLLDDLVLEGELQR